MSWCFAIINGRLVELFFEREEHEKEPRIQGHCYVLKSAYKMKREQQMIEKDIARYQFSYRNKKYRDKFTKKILRNARIEKRDTIGVPMTLESLKRYLKGTKKSRR